MKEEKKNNGFDPVPPNKADTPEQCFMVGENLGFLQGPCIQ